MHESSIVESLIKNLEKKVLSENIYKIIKINLVVGETTGYMEESLVHYFESLPKATALKDSILQIKYIKPQLLCKKCNKNFERTRFSFECPDCGETGEMTKIGTEFYIDNIEVEI
jgi:hydrogenase nickel incorporation protein HypA/HybF